MSGSVPRSSIARPVSHIGNDDIPSHDCVFVNDNPESRSLREKIEQRELPVEIIFWEAADKDALPILIFSGIHYGPGDPAVDNVLDFLEVDVTKSVAT